MAKLTKSAEDYLEAIYDLGGGKTGVRSVEIAEKLGVSRASVNKAVNLLKEDGLLIHEHYADLTLTSEGKARAKEVRETHNLIYGFFTEVLGVSQKAADEDACKVEHDLSKETLKKLKEFVKRIK